MRLISPDRLAQASGVAMQTTDQIFGNQATVGLGYFMGTVAEALVKEIRGGLGI